MNKQWMDMSFYVWCYVEKEKGLRNKGAIFMLLCSPQLALIHKNLRL